MHTATHTNADRYNTVGDVETDMNDNLPDLIRLMTKAARLKFEPIVIKLEVVLFLKCNVMTL